MNFRERSTFGLLDIFNTKHHLIREYKDRIAIQRHDGARMTWEELQEVKVYAIGDRVAVEVYPAQDDVVNLRHTRHLWFSPEIDAAVAATCAHPEFDKVLIDND